MSSIGVVDPPLTHVILGDMPKPSLSHVCEVCRRVLDFHEHEGYRHTIGDADADHAPVPIPAIEVDEIAGRCDFCYADGPEFVIPARDFEVVPGHESLGDWAACATCADLIGSDQWSRLVRRASEGYEQRHGPMDAQVAASLPRLYRLLRKNMSGSPRRMHTDRYGQGGKVE